MNGKFSHLIFCVCMDECVSVRGVRPACPLILNSAKKVSQATATLHEMALFRHKIIIVLACSVVV